MHGLCVDVVGQHKIYIKMILNESHFPFFSNIKIHQYEYRNQAKLRSKLGFSPFDLAFIFELHTVKYKVIKRVPS